MPTTFLGQDEPASVPGASTNSAFPAAQVAAPTANDSEDDEGVQSPGRTAEEIEAYWRNRVSKKDKAHQVAEQALREQIASLQATRSSGGQQGNSGEATPGGEDIARLQRELEQERQARSIDQRKAKYPALVEQGIADSIFASADDASLAKLNALADDTGGGLIAPTSPRRAVPAAQKPLNEKSKQELLADLREASKVYEATLRS